jgi:hypothetical protein
LFIHFLFTSHHHFNVIKKIEIATKTERKVISEDGERTLRRDPNKTKLKRANPKDFLMVFIIYHPLPLLSRGALNKISLTF